MEDHSGGMSAPSPPKWKINEENDILDNIIITNIFTNIIYIYIHPHDMYLGI